MVLEEGLFPEVPAGVGRGRSHGGLLEHPAVPTRVGGAVDVAGHQLEGGVRVGSAALVVDGDPAREVGTRVGGIDDHDVVGLPGDAARQVGRLDALGGRPRVAKQPDERGLGDQVVGQGGEDDLAVVPHVDLAVDLVDRPVGAEERHLLVGAVGLVEAHLLAHVLLHELGRRQEVVLVVLLEDLETCGVRERLEMHAGRIDLRGDIAELHLEHARVEPDLARVFHEAEIAVVDGHHHVLLVIARDRLGCRRRQVRTPQQ